MESHQEGFRKKLRVEQSPCIDCEKKGCGSYHDICEKYRAYKDKVEQSKQLIRSKNTGREYIKESTFKSRTSGQFRSHKK